MLSRRVVIYIFEFILMCHINETLDGTCRIRIIKKVYIHYIILNYSSEKGKNIWIMVTKIRQMLSWGVYKPTDFMYHT